MLRDLGADMGEVVFEATGTAQGPWIVGRGARVLVSGEELGQFGEIDPAVSQEFGLRSPIHAGEFDIEAAGRLISGPVV
jgi:phenylalanyl-tRNA synthetase beta subunit